MNNLIQFNEDLVRDLHNILKGVYSRFLGDKIWSFLVVELYDISDDIEYDVDSIFFENM